MDIAQRPWLRCRRWLAWTPRAAQCAGLAREGGLRPGATFAALGHSLGRGGSQRRRNVR